MNDGDFEKVSENNNDGEGNRENFEDFNPGEKKMKAQLKELPSRPGVYMFKDSGGEVIYVGKAKSLRSRLRSYFNGSSRRYKSRLLQEEAADFDYLITENEVEAYILEANLIKKHGPRYNVQLKDDKTYPYIKITAQEEFPRIKKTRIIKEDGARYFGPYADVEAVYRVMGTVKDLFKLRRCSGEIGDARSGGDGPCLNYHIDKCAAPCTGEVDSGEYGKKIESICSFLAGRESGLLALVEEQMRRAAEEKQFEEAADFRDGLRALKKLSRRQKVASGRQHNLDAAALVISEEKKLACVQMLFVRNGRLVGQDYVLLQETDLRDSKEAMSSFLQQYYAGSVDIPPEIIVTPEPAERDVIKAGLSRERGSKLNLKKPEQGDKKELLSMAGENAQENLKRAEIKRKYQEEQSARELAELRDRLNMKKLPHYIEGFDISNLRSEAAAAAMVVFKGGSPAKDMYRRFKIKDVKGQDDYAMLQEVLNRRYSRLLEEDRELPDLILIDGGKGQLSSAREILNELGLNNLKIISLAKKREEIFIPSEEDPLRISRRSPALKLLQRIRNEAHRFAVNYHRKLRSRRLTESMLDQISGVGPELRRSLLQHFGSLGEVRNATREQLQEVSGIGPARADKIYSYLRDHTRQV